MNIEKATFNNHVERLEDVYLENIASGGSNLLYKLRTNLLDYTTLYGTPIVSLSAIALHLTSRAYASKASKENGSGNIQKAKKYEKAAEKLNVAALSCVGLVAINSVATAACYLLDKD